MEQTGHAGTFADEPLAVLLSSGALSAGQSNKRWAGQ